LFKERSVIMRNNKTMRNVFVASLVLLLAAGLNAFGQAGGGAVKRIGIFTNMKFTKEHQYGYSVELWQEKDRVFGFFLASSGLAGDTPTGMLEDAVFNSKTGKLTFKARLSTGSTFDKNNNQVPTRDVYEFDGNLTGQRLSGTLKTKDALVPSTPAKKEKINLQRSRSESASMSKAKSYDEWKKEADEIMGLRGPKW
jgi:hypothetical protein